MENLPEFIFKITVERYKEKRNRSCKVETRSMKARAATYNRAILIGLSKFSNNGWEIMSIHVDIDLPF